jgi:hypothetical protein
LNLEAAVSGQFKSAYPILGAADDVGLSSSSIRPKVRGGFDRLGPNHVQNHATSFIIRDLMGRSIDFSTSAILDSACTTTARYGGCSLYSTYCGEIRSASPTVCAKARVLHRLRFVFGFVVGRPSLFFAGLCLRRRRHILAATREIEMGRAGAAAVMAAAAPAPGEDQAAETPSTAAASAVATLAAAVARAKGAERGSYDKISCMFSISPAPATEAGECYCPDRCKEEARLPAVVKPVGNAAAVATSVSASVSFSRAADAAAATSETIPLGAPWTSLAVTASAAIKGGCSEPQTFAICCSCGKAPSATRYYCRPCREMGCKVIYCDRECQRSHWPQHKPNCCRNKT